MTHEHANLCKLAAVEVEEVSTTAMLEELEEAGSSSSIHVQFQLVDLTPAMSNTIVK